MFLFIFIYYLLFIFIIYIIIIYILSQSTWIMLIYVCNHFMLRYWDLFWKKGEFLEKVFEISKKCFIVIGLSKKMVSLYCIFAHSKEYSTKKIILDVANKKKCQNQIVDLDRINLSSRTRIERGYTTNKVEIPNPHDASFIKLSAL